MWWIYLLCSIAGLFFLLIAVLLIRTFNFKPKFEQPIEHEVVDFDKLHAEIVARDKQDSEREFSPLVCAEDAVVIDTSDMDVTEVVLTIKKAIQSKI